MGATFPALRTEDEAVEHLHSQHGALVGDLDTWHLMFPNGRLPSSEHDKAHEAKLPGARSHRHALLRALP